MCEIFHPRVKTNKLNTILIPLDPCPMIQWDPESYKSFLHNCFFFFSVCFAVHGAQLGFSCFSVFESQRWLLNWGLDTLFPDHALETYSPGIVERSEKQALDELREDLDLIVPFTVCRHPRKPLISLYSSYLLEIKKGHSATNLLNKLVWTWVP